MEGLARLEGPPVVRLPQRCLVVLVGPSGSGKTTWAEQHFPAGTVVSTDRLRAMVGEGESDQAAGADAFAVLDLIVEARLARGLLTVVDTLGLDDEQRSGYVERARRHGVMAVAVGFDTPPKVCRERNRARSEPVPDRVVGAQLNRWVEVRDRLDGEGFDAVLSPGPVRIVADRFLAVGSATERQRSEPVALRFGLQIPSFTWGGGSESMADELTAVAGAAGDAGFESLWVMDHMRQIPQVGRDWDPMLEAYTTLGFLAAASRGIRLGTLVTGITYRNVALVGKMVATLDVLSGGRMVCGLGAAWYEREHRAYGWELPAAGHRLDLLEDALQLLPVLWGPGSKPFTGAVLSVPDTTCYPRPLQERIPLLVGGSGERRTLDLVARYADACNLFGDVETVRRKVAVLAGHCRAAGRDPAEVAVTHLTTAVAAADPESLSEIVDRLRPARTSAARFAAQTNAATVGDQIGRFRELAEAGVQTAIVSLPPVATVEAIERFAPVIAAFSSQLPGA